MSLRMENNLTEGSALKKLVSFALPFLAANIMQSLYNVADMLIVGQFGSADGMAGVNIGGQVTFVLTNAVIGLCVGATALIGQYVGKGDMYALKRVTSTIISVLILSSVALTAAVLAFIGPVLRLIQTPADSYADSRAFLTVTVSGLIFIFGYNALAAILRGMGDSKRPFYFVSVACVTNVLLDLLFVAALRWSAFGAALATVISQALSMFLCIIYMTRHGFQFDFRLKSYRIYKDQLALILKIGLPAGFQNAIVSISFLFVTAVVNMTSGGSSIPSAAAGAVGKFNSFAYMPAAAMSASIATMSAQSFGAGKLDRAVKSCKMGMAFSIAVLYIFFGFVQLFPESVLRVFSSDPALIKAGVAYIRGVAFDFLLVPVIFCVNGLFIGGGHTFFTLMNSVMSSVLLRVPVCYLLGITLNMGLFGVGLGVPVASAGSLIAIVIFLLTGRWKRNAIKHADGGSEFGTCAQPPE
ncbi:MAG: MATE family efflux transporter [Firmicutes bacterium]|nr:MATE family efflux transporter [Bacillota bacterium]